MVFQRIASWAQENLPPRLTTTLQSGYQLVRRFKRAPNSGLAIMSYPPFNDLETLSFHLKRVYWYLGDLHPTIICTIYLPYKGLSRDDLDRANEKALKVLGNSNGLELVFIDIALFSSPRIKNIHLILEWQSGHRYLLEDAMRKQRSIRQARIFSVDPWDPNDREYAVFANLAWHELWGSEARSEIRSKSHETLVDLICDLKSRNAPALVFGTGPSFSEYKAMKREGTVIACNSIVEDEDFFVKMRPDFFVFADAAHHVGPSKRAQRFREQLRARLRQFPAFYVVTTDRFAPIILREFGEFQSRFIFLQQSALRNPNFRLETNRFAPAMNSVSVIYMLPLAGSVANQIVLVGFDGDLDGIAKDDFWAHDEGLAYGVHIEEFHEMHPTYRIEREKRGTKKAYYKDMEDTLTYGESAFGKKFIAIAASSIPAVQERFMPSATSDGIGH